MWNISIKKAATAAVPAYVRAHATGFGGLTTDNLIDRFGEWLKQQHF
jgi:hypothetical protein